MTRTMQAMQLDAPGTPLRLVERAVPAPGPGELLVEVSACGVCRTDLHIVDGELRGPLPIVPGHEIVGRVAALGPGAEGFAPGDRVGIPWLGRTCGACTYCRSGRENLCDFPRFTGFTRDGGYATHAVADAAYCFPIPDAFGDVEAAPLLCAGLIGWRALKKAGEGRTLGFYGFGAAAHIVAQLAAWQGRTVFAFTRPGDAAGQAFARALGCAWAGGSDEAPPEPLDAAIIFAPVGALVPEALRRVAKGGRVVCAGIHMSDVPAFPYADLWGERAILSVANLTRGDGREFLPLAAQAGVRPSTRTFPLAEADQALAMLRAGAIEGAAILRP
jgi:alcohol dehydrogenase, propanol-preferring